MRETYVAALDQGTTSTRCVLYDHRGRMVAVAQQEHGQVCPQPGWVEHDAAKIWALACRLIPQALVDAEVKPEQVVALGVTNQRETTVVWDRFTGQPVAPAIVWQDTRTANVLDELTDHFDPEQIRQRTGLPLATYFSGPKLRWILDLDPFLRKRAEAGELLFGTMDTWLIWNLTGGPDGGLHITDVTNASRTMLMNLETLDWDDELLSCMRVPRGMLPSIRPSLGFVAETTVPVPGIPIAAVIGDQQASLFGHAGFDPGDAKCTFGTGGFLLMNTGTKPVPSQHGLISTVAYKIEGEPAVFALEGSIAVTGALVQWCRDNLGLIRSPAEIETLALTVPDNGGCYLVPAFAGLYAPHWKNRAQGLLVGLTSHATRGHLARAVLEATAWQTAEVVEAMTRDSGVPMTSLAVDGGMTGNNLLMQTVSDCLGVPVVRPMMAETVALGAAYAAGLVVGYWADRAQFRQNWHRAAEWAPQIQDHQRRTELEQWKHAVKLAIQWGERPRP